MSDDPERQSLLQDLSACDTATLRRLVSLLGARDSAADSGKGYLDFLHAVADSDIGGLRTSEKSYGNSWKLRGGVDTFHMLKRKWERLEKRVATDIAGGAAVPGASPYDIFEHLSADRGADGLIDDVRDLRRYLMLVEAEMAARTKAGVADSGRSYLGELDAIARNDVEIIEDKEKSYSNSWKRSGGIGAFMMLARKWDRIAKRVATGIEASNGTPAASRDNVFEHLAADRRAEGMIEDISGLRQYLLLVEAEMAARGEVEIGTARDNRTAG